MTRRSLEALAIALAAFFLGLAVGTASATTPSASEPEPSWRPILSGAPQLTSTPRAGFTDWDASQATESGAPTLPATTDATSLPPSDPPATPTPALPRSASGTSLSVTGIASFYCSAAYRSPCTRAICHIDKGRSWKHVLRFTPAMVDSGAALTVIERALGKEPEPAGGPGGGVRWTNG